MLGPGTFEGDITFASSRRNEISPLFSVTRFRDHLQQIGRRCLKTTNTIHKGQSLIRHVITVTIL